MEFATFFVAVPVAAAAATKATVWAAALFGLRRRDTGTPVAPGATLEEIEAANAESNGNEASSVSRVT
jgi:hypothetical protein